jgi:pilus assembly protein FimV
MVRKKLAVVVAALGAMHAGMVSALGLGDFSLNSALNQPLDAEIKLLNASELDESQVIVQLATAEDFKTAGVEREFFLTNLNFKVVIHEDGTGVIKISSHESVVEPYLDFLVEARWPNGRLLREYTVLMDLPVYSDSQPAAVQAATVAQPSVAAAPSAAASSPATVPAPASSSRQDLRQGELTAGEEYRVRQNDTLWQIASKAKPNDQTSVQQTMLAIQRLNPNAFIKGNINNLKAGYVLRLPTGEELDDISAREAVSQVASQNRQWKTGESVVASEGGAQLDASGSASVGDDGVDDESRLSLGSAGSSTSGSMGDGSGVNAEGIQSLQKELDQAKEGLDESGRENVELQSRLQDMEARIATLQRLLELKDDQLASMQGGLAEEDPQPADAVVIEEAVGGEDEATISDTQALDEQAEDTVLNEQPVAEVAEEVVQEKRPEPAPVTAEPGLVERVIANPLYAGAGLVVLVLVLLLVMRRKNKADESAVEDAFEDVGAETEIDEGFDEPDVDTVEAPEDDVNIDDVDVGTFATGLDEVEVPEESPAPVSTQPETGDAIAEADIYIAYGRYQQAIDLLTTAINQAPQRADFHVKLMEVYLETRDKPAFQQQYGSLQQLGDDTAIVRVKEMLSTIDGVSDWLDGMGAPAAVITDEDMDAELIEGDDLQLDVDDAGEVELDLDLDDEADLTLEVEAVDIDLDLDDGLLEELSDSDTVQFNAVDLEISADSLDLDELDLDDSDLELDLDSASDTEETVVGEAALDNADLDLGEEPALEPEAGANTDELQLDSESDSADAEGFDLDLDLDSDFDLDLDDLSADADLGDLEAEFDGGAAAEVQSEPEPEPEPEIAVDAEVASDSVPELGDLDLDLDADDLVSAASLDSSEATEVIEQSDATVDTSDDDDFDFLSDTDEVATKLDLARAYIDMGDSEGAKDILDEVAQEGTDEQKQEASSLSERID